jgi:hypothetical protein
VQSQFIIVPMYRKGNKTDFNNYWGISVLPTSYRILSNIILSRLSPYIDRVTKEHQYGFRCNRSTTNQIFCIRQILSMDLKKTYGSVKRKAFYNVLIQFHMPMKLARLIKMCLHKNSSKVRIGKTLVLYVSYSEWSKTGGCFLTIVFQLWFRICH